MKPACWHVVLLYAPTQTPEALYSSAYDTAEYRHTEPVLYAAILPLEQIATVTNQAGYLQDYIKQQCLK